MIYFDKPFKYLGLFYARVYGNLMILSFCNCFRIKVVKRVYLCISCKDTLSIDCEDVCYA